MNKYLYLALLPAALLFQNTFAQEATVYSEQAGRLVVEIESAAIAGDWHQAADFAGYRGSGHYEWTGSNNTNVKNAGEGILTYHFTINTPGNYEFRLRSHIGEGNNKTESNDSWVRFPTGSNISGEQALDDWTKAYMNKLDEWTWITKTVDNVGRKLRQHFTAGDHTLQISGRSRGHVIDRFALYKYDTVTFNDEQFTAAAESPSNNKIVVSTNESITENNTTPDTGDNDLVSQASTSATTQQWEVAAGQPAANSCIANTISLQPLNDIYVESNDIKHNGNLWVDDDKRKILLKFDLSGVPVTTTAATLSWSIGKDDGEGTIILSAGSQSSWNETDESRLPDTSHQIGRYHGTWNYEQRYGFPFDYALLGSDSATLIMEMEQGANGIAIIPTVNDGEPRLELTGTGNYCSDYENNQNNPGTSESLSALNIEPESGQANPAQTNTAQGNSTGGGALGILEFLFLTTIITGLLRART